MNDKKLMDIGNLLDNCGLIVTEKDRGRYVLRSSLEHFSYVFKKNFNMSPGAYRKSNFCV